LQIYHEVLVRHQSRSYRMNANNEHKQVVNQFLIIYRDMDLKSY